MKKATNSSVMRKKNEKMILSIINRLPTSRAQIAKMTGLTKAAVTIITDDLIKRGIVREEEGAAEGVGRRPVILYIDAESVYVIGINISRRGITVGLADIGGEVLGEEEFEISCPDLAFMQIDAVVDRLIERCGVNRAKIYKAGLAVPGPIDAGRGMILNPPNFNGWNNICVKDKIEELTGFEAVLENVSNAAALAEQYFGAARNAGDFVALLVDEGVGSGIVTDGSLFRGICEIGHVSIKYDGVMCECGNRGCLEKYASVSALTKGHGYSTWTEIADNNDIGLIEKEAEYLAAGIITANNIFDLDMAVITGDLTYKPELLIDKIKECLKGRLITGKTLAVYPGRINSQTVIAAAAAVNDFFEG